MNGIARLEVAERSGRDALNAGGTDELPGASLQNRGHDVTSLPYAQHKRRRVEPLGRYKSAIATHLLLEHD